MGVPQDALEVTGQCLLFFLVFGMTATVDMGCLLKQLHNKRAILTGLTLQFGLLPLLGFLTVKMLNMDNITGLMLLVVTSSPGGSYSNWWCSVFNADLALSVTMTAISTIVAIVMLPLNLIIYSKMAFNNNREDVVDIIDFGSLFTSLIVVFSAIGMGLFATAKVDSHNFNVLANRFGNFAGIALLIFSAIVSNGNEESQMWQRDWKFYVGCFMPCVFALITANIVTTYTGLKKPERVASSIECCYQNTGIAASVAISMFQGNNLSEAMGVPFFYGIVEIICLGIYCVGAWKAGWTKAPPEEPLWRVLTCSYEVLVAESLEKNKVDVEVKLGHDTELEDEEYVNVAGCGGCLYYCHNPCIDDFDLESMDHNKRVKRGPKEESFVPITLQADYLKSLGYKVKDDSML